MSLFANISTDCWNFLLDLINFQAPNDWTWLIVIGSWYMNRNIWAALIINKSKHQYRRIKTWDNSWIPLNTPHWLCDSIDNHQVVKLWRQNDWTWMNFKASNDWRWIVSLQDMFNLLQEKNVDISNGHYFKASLFICQPFSKPSIWFQKWIGYD